jgi:hypothetical protein
MNKPTLEQFHAYLLTQKGFRLDRDNELRYYGFKFWELDKCIIEKMINGYEENNNKRKS